MKNHHYYNVYYIVKLARKYYYFMSVKVQRACDFAYLEKIHISACAEMHFDKA